MVYTQWKPLIDSLRREAPLLTLPGGEACKTLPYVRYLWKKYWQYRIDRGQVILLIGGGSLLDVGAFTASTWKRGVPFVSVPTTLIAQIDAAIGGKTGINFKQGKNLIGTYAEAQAIWIWEGFLRTLSPRELRAGWVEALKHALLQGPELWEEVKQNRLQGIPSSDLLARLAQVKLSLVAQDPYETKGVREYLNLGHTLGHVWESLSLRTASPLLHGEAVAIGLLQEAYLSAQLNLLPADIASQLEGVLKQAELLMPLPPFTWRQWEKVLLQDKKIRKGILRVPLLKQIGEVVLVEVSVEQLKKAVRVYKEAFGVCKP
uniref:3-dehydroquinate synthetase n=1 Tax=uncultured Bacteroidota bacterium TaxID=152509 RepID=H5SMR0_9BACT|nr:3-dehydroquinate synthetase [uncultured Bacteroidetes bacterium]